MPPLARSALRWLLRVVAALALLVLLLLGSSPWTLPALLRREIPRVAAAQIGRVVRVGQIQFNPLRLRLRVHDLRVLDASGHADALVLPEGIVRLDWSSLWRLHPRFGAVRLQGLRLRVVRDPAGRFDFEDILRRLARRPAGTPASPPPAFALDQLQLSDGSLDYQDLSSHVQTQLRKLHLQLSHLSSIASPGGGLQARASGLLDGAPLKLGFSGEVFGAHPMLRIELQLQKFPLAPWSAAQPASLPARLTQGSLDTTLQLQWPLRGAVGPTLSGTLQLHALEFERAGQPFAQIRQVALQLASVRPLQHDMRLGTLDVQGLKLQLDREQLATTREAQPPAPASTPAPAASAPRRAPSSSASAPARPTPTASAPTAAAWRIRLAGARVQDTRLQWTDSSVQPAVDWRFNIPQMQLGAVNWPLGAASDKQASGAQLRGRLLGPQGLDVAWQAEADTSGYRATLQLQGLDPQLPRPYLRPLLGGTPLPSGTLQGQLDLRWKAGLLRVDLPELQWKSFSWQPHGTAAGIGPRARDIRLRDAHVDWRSRPAELRITAAALDIEQPATGPGAGVRAQALQLRDASVDVPAHVVRLGQLDVLAPQASLARDSSGTWSLGQLLPAGLLPAHAAARKPAAAAAATPWRVEVADARVRGGSAYLADTYPARPVVLALTGLDAELRHASWPMRGAAELQLLAHVRDARQAPAAGDKAGGGVLRLRGQLRAAPWRLHATVQAQGLPAQVVGNYLPRINARVLRASANADGQLDLSLGARGPQLGFDGNVGVDGFAADTLQPPGSLLGWRALELQRLRLRVDPRAQPATRIDVAQVLLHDFYARLSLSPQARLNVTEVFRAAAPQHAAAATAAHQATAPTPAAHAAPQASPVRVRVGGITLDHGRIDWSDHFVQPNYSASLSEVHGSIGGFASDSPAQAEVDLRAVAEGTAPVSLSGKANPLASPPQLNLQGRVDELQLAPLSPYSTRYAGYGIRRGLLSMDVHYDIDAAGKLRADNRLVLRQLSFGPHVDSPTATKLPVLLAVDLLKDRNGNINLDIPISGSLKDPEFNLGSVIAEAVGKLLLRAITAPFSLMGHLLAGGKPPPRLDVVPFAPGSTRLAADAAPRLQDIAALLKAKPHLVVTITGQSCSATEPQALREAVLEGQLLAQWRSTLPRAEAYAHAKDTRVPADAREQALAALYRSTSLPGKPRDALGLARSVPAQTMQQLLLRAIPDGGDQLQALAMRRAVALRDALNQLGVPAVRQFIAAPELLDASHKDCAPSARLSVSLP